MKRIARLVTCLLIIAPVFLCLWYVNAFGVNVPYWDAWGLVVLLKQFYEGNISWINILFEQGNEHLSGIPDLLMVCLAKLTHYNVRTEMFANWLFLVMTWILILKIAKNRLPKGIAYTIALIPISWLVCSLRQYEALLLGLQNQAFTSIFFFVLSLYLLDRTGKYEYCFLGLAAISGFCSTFSFANGALIWPLGMLQILLKHLWENNLKKSFKPLIIWLLVSLAVCFCCMCCYRSDYLSNNIYGLTAAMWPSRIWDIVSFLVVYLASPLIATVNDNFANSYPDIVVTQGLSIAAIYAAAVILAMRETQDCRRRLLVPLILILYVVMSDCLTTIARVGGGINQALASRYTSVSGLGIAGVYLVLLIISKVSTKTRAFLLGALLLPIFASAIICTKVGLEEGSRIKTQRILLSYVVLSCKQQDPRLFPLLKLPGNLQELASFLEINKLCVFRRPHPNLHIPRINVDSVRAVAKQELR